MSSISFNVKGNFKNFISGLERMKNFFRFGALDKYGKMGVEALKANTPRDSGETAESWTYKIVHSKNSATIEFHNSNIQNGYNVAMILYTGHATKAGYWVQGVDYIDPALTPIFEEMAKNALKEATE